MALAQRNRSGGVQNYIWPGFVDGLATLLMVIIFVLMVFFLIQTNLAVRVSGQDEALTRLNAQIFELGDLLNLEKAKTTELLENNQRLQNAITEADARANAKQAELDARNSEVQTLAARLADIKQARDQAIAERDATIAEREATIAASKQEILALTQSADALKEKLGQIQALLEEKQEEARIAKEASLNLTRQLNDALSSKLAELQKFRSEFFGQLRDILKDRSDILIVGDRFVFQSEVLFDTGSADIGTEGQKQLLDLSNALQEISNAIPTNIDWVLQVSGHTDNRPINTSLYRDNWDLSSARAISVVRFLTLAGVDPNRLAAAGFGEFQPIDTADSDAARAKNRRIELKITQR